MRETKKGFIGRANKRGVGGGVKGWSLAKKNVKEKHTFF